MMDGTATEWLVGAVLAGPALIIGVGSIIKIAKAVGRIEFQINNGLNATLNDVKDRTGNLERRMAAVETHLEVLRSHCPVCPSAGEKSHGRDTKAQD